jgi:hypothetical protein
MDASGDWCALACGNDDDRAGANAHLIAAAPELYEACELALSFWYSDYPNDTYEGHSAHDKIKAALAKARGEQP